MGSNCPGNELIDLIMSQSLDQLVNVGQKLLDDSNDPNEAHSEHEGFGSVCDAVLLNWVQFTRSA